MKLPITGQQLFDLIPQKSPFVFISSLEQVSSTHSVTKFIVPENNVLCNNLQLTAAGLLENIAQTAAAKAGYECKLQGKKIPIGFIGDVREFSFSLLPTVGNEIETEITITHTIFNVSMIKGSVKLFGTPIANCTMKIFTEPEPVKEHPST